MKKSIYLDHNSTTPLRPEVLEAAFPYLRELYGNASSIHEKGREAREAVEKARETVASFLGTKPNTILFTSGGTEANNFAIKGIGFRNKTKGNHIISTRIEHPCVLDTCKFMESQGFEVTLLPVDREGRISVEDLKHAITDRTILVSIMHANNEVGTIQPIAELAKVAKERGVYFHTDAVQSFGKIPVDVEDLGVDLLSVSAHKLYGPKGVGCLYVRKDVRILPHQHGGHHERGLRAGTENVAGIVGLGKAVSLARQEMEKRTQHLRALQEKFYEGILKRIDDVLLNGHPTERIPGTVNLGFKDVEGESMAINLDLKGICVSTGSACTAGSLEPSHVLVAMGVPQEYARGTVRFSLGHENTQEEMDYCLTEIPKIVKRLREMVTKPSH
ncbi:MAG: cysteine desulfurase NifS [Candidatus Omnitrophica bacterium]|nr:cysteine desulfurase NifS [Candidatus Omnitrophota bacterium]